MDIVISNDLYFCSEKKVVITCSRYLVFFCYGTHVLHIKIYISGSSWNRGNRISEETIFQIGLM